MGIRDLDALIAEARGNASGISDGRHSRPPRVSSMRATWPATGRARSRDGSIGSAIA